MSGRAYVLAASRPWCWPMAQRLAAKTGRAFTLVRTPEELRPEALEAVNPRYVFFPHWSAHIPEKIWKTHECVIFHMTDLPFGRGGSPLQNLIARGIHETKISALRCVQELDAGPVYGKRPLCLHGGAQEIYLRAAAIIESMIEDILRAEPLPVPQTGEPVSFRRRTPAEGDVSGLESLEKVHDYIRMLDAEGYPPAFLEAGNLRLEFSRSSLKDGAVVADARITLINR